MDGGGAEFRPDEDDLGAVVARLREEVRVRDLRVERVATPDQDQVGEEEVVGRAIEADLAEGLGEPPAPIADLRVGIEARGVQQQGEALVGDGQHAEGVERPEVEDDAVASFLR